MKNLQNLMQGVGLAEMLLGAMTKGGTGSNGMEALGGLLTGGAQGRAAANNPLGTLLGTLLSGSGRTSRRNPMSGSGLAALGTLAFQFLRKWAAERQTQSQQTQRRTAQAPYPYGQTQQHPSYGHGQVPPPYNQPTQQVNYGQGRAQVPPPYGAGGQTQSYGFGGQAQSMGSNDAGSVTDAGWPTELTQPPHPMNAEEQVAYLPPNDAVTLLLLEAIVYAARADGHIDDDERQFIESAIADMFPTQNMTAVIKELLTKPIDPQRLAARVESIDEARDLYRLSCAAINLDSFAERSYINALGDALCLASEDRNQLELEARAGQEEPPSQLV